MMNDDLKQAVLSLSTKEKDKLLIRLIRKDKILTEQLHYRLLENSQTDLDYRMAIIKDKADAYFSKNINDCSDLEYYFKRVVVDINHYFKITKDIKGELELLIYCFNKVQGYPNLYLGNPTGLRQWKIKKYREKLKAYSINKLAKAKQLLNKLHEDYQIEYADDLERVECFISSIPVD